MGFAQKKCWWAIARCAGRQERWLAWQMDLALAAWATLMCWQQQSVTWQPPQRHQTWLPFRYSRIAPCNTDCPCFSEIDKHFAPHGFVCFTECARMTLRMPHHCCQIHCLFLFMFYFTRTSVLCLVFLQVEYREKLYAIGKIPHNYMRREGTPGEREILCMRLIDRAIRPLFPSGFCHEVQVGRWYIQHYHFPAPQSAFASLLLHTGHPHLHHHHVGVIWWTGRIPHLS